MLNVMSLFFVFEFVMICSISLIMAQVSDERAFGVVFLFSLLSILVAILLKKEDFE